MGFSKISAKRKFIAMQAYLMKQETSNKHNFTLKATRIRTKNPKFNRMKEIINIRAEINEKGLKKTIAKINKLKVVSLRR